MPLPLSSNSADNCWSRRQQLGELSPLLSISANDYTNNWGSRRQRLGSRCRRRPTPLTTGRASLPSPLRCLLIRIWGRHHPSPPTTGGPIAAVVRLCRQLGEGLLPLPPLSISANDWGTRLRHHPSLPMTRGAVVDVATFVRLCRRLLEPLLMTEGAVTAFVRLCEQLCQRLGGPSPTTGEQLPPSSNSTDD